MSTFLDHLTCPICMEIPEGTVYQCRNGHTFCQKCSIYLKTCPQCRVDLSRHDQIRNRTMEQLLDEMEFKCSNSGLGCDKVLKRSEILSHLQYCKYEPFYFCKLLGFQKCAWNAHKADHPQDILLHLRQAHPEIPEISSQSLCINYKDFFVRIRNLEKNCISIWTPFLVNYKTHPDTIFPEVLLFLCQISQITQNAAWICLGMNESSKTNEEAKDGECSVTTNNFHSKFNKPFRDITLEYVLTARRSEHSSDLLLPEMNWKAPVMGFRDIEKELESYALRVPLSVLNVFDFSGCENGHNLKMKIKVGYSGNSHEKIEENNDVKEIVISELTSFISNVRIKPKDEEEIEHIVFQGIFCNGCSCRPLVNVRYKCLQCIDYDLCSKCMDSRVHCHHIFARIQDWRQNDLINSKHRTRKLKGKSSYI